MEMNVSDMHDQETTPATGPPTAAPTQPVTGVLAEGREHPVEGRFIPAAPYTGWAEDTDDETEGDDTHTPAAPQEQARGDESAPATRFSTRVNILFPGFGVSGISPAAPRIRCSVTAFGALMA